MRTTSSAPHKVLRIIARLNVGGPARHVILLSQGLSSRGFDTTLVTGSVSPGEGDMSACAREKNVAFTVASGLRRDASWWDDLRAFTYLLRTVLRERPVIIHTHTAKAGTLGRLAGIAARAAGRHPRMVHTFHGHVLTGYFSARRSRLYALIERFLARFTDVIVTVSEGVKDELVKLRVAPVGKIKVVPLGLELDRLAALAPPPRDPAVVRVGIVGRLAPIKNHELFLRAVALTCAGCSRPVRFHVYGDGELRTQLERFSRALGIGARVEFYGWQHDLPALYGRLDLVALTSDNEGTPVSLIEAMAAGRPVIATEVGGVGELLGPLRPGEAAAGFRVRARGIGTAAGDAQGFSQGLIRLLEDAPLRLAMGEAARPFAVGNFSVARLLDDVGQLYSSML